MCATIRGVPPAGPHSEGTTVHSEHHGIVASFFATSISEAFPKQRRGPRQTYIQDDTWAVVEDAKVMHAKLHEERLRFRRVEKKRWFMRWKCGFQNRHILQPHAEHLRNLCADWKAARLNLLYTVLVYTQLQTMKHRFLGFDFIDKIRSLGDRVVRADQDAVTRNTSIHASVKPFRGPNKKVITFS